MAFENAVLKDNKNLAPVYHHAVIVFTVKDYLPRVAPSWRINMLIELSGESSKARRKEILKMLLLT